MEEHRSTQGFWRCSSDKKEPGFIQVEMRFLVPTMILRWPPYLPHRPKAPGLLGNLFLPLAGLIAGRTMQLELMPVLARNRLSL